MKGFSYVLGTSILFLMVLSHWNFVTAVSSTNSAVKTPANVTLFTENSNISHPHNTLQFSPDTSSYLHWKLSGR